MGRSVPIPPPDPELIELKIFRLQGTPFAIHQCNAIVIAENEDEAARLIISAGAWSGLTSSQFIGYAQIDCSCLPFQDRRYLVHLF